MNWNELKDLTPGTQICVITYKGKGADRIPSVSVPYTLVSVDANDKTAKVKAPGVIGSAGATMTCKTAQFLCLPDSDEYRRLKAAEVAAADAWERELEAKKIELEAVTARNERLQAVFALAGLEIAVQGLSEDRTGVTLRKMSPEAAERLAEIISAHFAN